MYDIIVVGAGPAGMTAAIYGLRANKKVLVIDSKGYGGQIINAFKVENYPGIMNISGFELATNMYNQLKNLKCEFRVESVIKLERNKVITNKDNYSTKAIIIATGVNSRKLNIENENKFMGKGISYCATCDGNFYKDKVVAVVGGGNTALEDTLYLSNVARMVYLIHRRDSFRGDNKYLDEIKMCSNIKIITNTNVSKLLGDDILSGVELIDNDGKKENIDIDGLFIAIGQEPNNQIFKDIIGIDDDGYIISSDGVHTSCDGIYVAGDARIKELRQLTTAVSDGAIAATVAIKEMGKENNGI